MSVLEKYQYIIRSHSLADTIPLKTKRLFTRARFIARNIHMMVVQNPLVY